MVGGDVRVRLPASGVDEVKRDKREDRGFRERWGTTDFYTQTTEVTHRVNSTIPTMKGNDHTRV